MFYFPFALLALVLFLATGMSASQNILRPD
jgi:hypothetical protein